MNPFMIGFTLAVIGFALLLKNKKKFGIVVSMISFFWLWICSTSTASVLLGIPLEKPFLQYEKVESSPEADAIVVLGGGISRAKEMSFPDANDAADRIWHAARLWKANKAKTIILSGIDEEIAAKVLLLDFGVPEEHVIVDNFSRNTYENSRFTENIIKEKYPEKKKYSILLVTSAWHMGRALGNFSKTSLKAIPAPSDFKAYTSYYLSEWYDYFLPSPVGIAWTGTFMKEWIGRLARK